VTQLYYAPCAVYGSTRLWIPPGLAVNIVEEQKVTALNPLRGNRAIVAALERNQGQAISIQGDWIESDPTTKSVLDAWVSLRNLFGRTFDFFIFSDRGFRNCVIRSMGREIPRTKLGVINFSLEIFCPEPAETTAIQLAFTDFESEYPYANRVGRPLDEAASGGEIVSGQPALQIFNLTFPGVQDEATAAGQETRFVVGGESGTNWVVKRVQVVSCEPLSSTGTSTVRVSTGGVGSPMGFVAASVGVGAHFGDPVAGTLVVSAGETLFAFVTQGQGHQNLQVAVTLQQQN
jgi:hypothetical protein